MCVTANQPRLRFGSCCRRRGLQAGCGAAAAVARGEQTARPIVVGRLAAACCCVRVDRVLAAVGRSLQPAACSEPSDWCKERSLNISTRRSGVQCRRSLVTERRRNSDGWQAARYQRISDASRQSTRLKPSLSADLSASAFQTFVATRDSAGSTRSSQLAARASTSSQNALVAAHCNAHCSLQCAAAGGRRSACLCLRAPKTVSGALRAVRACRCRCRSRRRRHSQRVCVRTAQRSPPFCFAVCSVPVVRASSALARRRRVCALHCASITSNSGRLRATTYSCAGRPSAAPVCARCFPRPPTLDVPRSNAPEPRRAQNQPDRFLLFFDNLARK